MHGGRSGSGGGAATAAGADMRDILRLAEQTAEHGSFSSDEEHNSQGASLSLYSASDTDTDADDEDGGTVMALFANYYGMAGGKQKGQAAAPQENSLDSPAFNADAYAKMLLQSRDLKELLDHDDCMVDEIKTLDSDMQMLVYENYNKFIAATETIRRMKVNVETMETDMTALQESMTDVSVNSAVLETSLQDKRVKIDKLVRVKRLLRRLDFLCELPQRLKSMIDDERYEAAVGLYQKTSIVLRKHAHVLSFRRIQEETEQMITNLRMTVSKKLDHPSLDASTLSIYAGILLSLRSSPSELLSKFVNAHRQRSVRVLGKYQKDIEATLSAADERTAFRKFHQLFVTELLEAVAGIRTHFVPLTQNLVESPSERAAPTSLQQENIFTHLKSLLELVGDPYVKLLTRQAQKVCARSSISLEQSSDEQIPIQLQLSMLRQSVADMCTAESEAHNCVAAVNRPLPEIGKRCSKAVQMILSEQCVVHSETVRTQALERLLSACADAQRIVGNIAEDFQSNIKSVIQDRIGLAGQLVASLHQETFLALATCMKQMQPLLQLQEALVANDEKHAIATPKARFADEERSPAGESLGVGFVDRLCTDVERAMGIVARFDSGDGTFTQAKDIELRLFSYTGPSFRHETALCLLIAHCMRSMSQGIAGLDQMTDGQLGRSVIGLIEERLSQSSIRLLLQYTELKAHDLTQLATGIFSHIEITAASVSDSAVSLCVGIDTAMCECSIFLLEPPPSKPVGNVARIRDQDYRRTLNNQGGLRFDLDRLFSQKVTTFHVPTRDTVWDIETVLGGVIRATFKATAQTARLKFFPLSVYKGVQIDTALLRQVLPFFLQDTSVAEELLEQVMIAVADRAMDGSTPGLDGNTLATILGREQPRIIAACPMLRR